LDERGEWVARENIDRKMTSSQFIDGIICERYYTFLIARIITPITKLTTADNKNGTVEPN